MAELDFLETSKVDVKNIAIYETDDEQYSFGQIPKIHNLKNGYYRFNGYAMAINKAIFKVCIETYYVVEDKSIDRDYSVYTSFLIETENGRLFSGNSRESFLLMLDLLQKSLIHFSKVFRRETDNKIAMRPLSDAELRANTLRLLTNLSVID